MQREVVIDQEYVDEDVVMSDISEHDYPDDEDEFYDQSSDHGQDDYSRLRNDYVMHPELCACDLCETQGHEDGCNSDCECCYFYFCYPFFFWYFIIGLMHP